jgi:hypothetical protein
MEENGCQFSKLNWSIWTQQNYTDAIEKIECSDYDEACYMYETLKKENPDAFRISMMANDKYELFTNRNREYFTGHNLEN